MERQPDASAQFWKPRRAAIATVLICAVLGVVAYLVFLIDSKSGGYGPHIAFPALRDHDSIRIALSRSSCFGPCPDYSVEIRGDGTVIYEGKRCVAVRGHHDGRILESRVDELFEQFKSAEFLSLRESYAALITDNPAYVISLSYDGVSKAVTDYAGTRAGMPGVVTNLENAIDDFAQIEVWVLGSERQC
jgi:hypothetical protein